MNFSDFEIMLDNFMKEEHSPEEASQDTPQSRENRERVAISLCSYMPDEEIVCVTGLSMERVKELRKKAFHSFAW